MAKLFGKYEYTECLYCSKDRIWAKIDDGKARAGLIDFAQQTSAKTRFIRSKPPGCARTCGDVMARGHITKDLALAMSCVGERMMSMAGDDELSVGIPINVFNSVLEGLESIKMAALYPIPFGWLDQISDCFLTEYAEKKIEEKG